MLACYIANNMDEKIFELQIKKYLKPVYGFALRYVGNREDAEDVTQETFIKAWKNLKKFDQQKSFKTWIFTIAKNTAIDLLKKKHSLVFSDFENNNDENYLFENLRDFASIPRELSEQQDIMSAIFQAMDALLPKYRMVLALRYNKHFAFREIADALGKPLNTVKSIHRRGLAMLQKLLIVHQN